MQKNKINKMYLVSNEIAVLEILMGLDKNDRKILESTNIKFYVHVFFSQLSDHYLYCHITLKLQISSPLYKNHAKGGIRTRGYRLTVPRLNESRNNVRSSELLLTVITTHMMP